VTTYNLYFVTKYVLKYIEAMKGGEKMVTTEKIVNKAFKNGIMLRDTLLTAEQKKSN